MFSPEASFVVVDDSFAIRSLIKSQLLSLGFKNVFEAENGKEALALIENTLASGLKVDLVIADWNMPVMSGLDLLKKLKGSQNLSGIPFLMITSESELEQVAKAISAGVTSYLVKPFTEEALAEKLQKVYKKSSS